MKLHHVLVAGLAVGSMVFAQEEAVPASCAAAKAPAEKAVKKEGVRKVTGPIVSVDAVAGTLVVKGRKGEDTLTVNDKTVIMVGGNTVALADLKAGSKVKVQYKTIEGVKTAARITEVPADPAAPEKAKGKGKKAEAAPATPAVPATPATPAEPAQ
jgi:hypothetical protein